jgi:hypothetical protein
MEWIFGPFSAGFSGMVRPAKPLRFPEVTGGLFLKDPLSTNWINWFA